MLPWCSIRNLSNVTKEWDNCVIGFCVNWVWWSGEFQHSLPHLRLVCNLATCAKRRRGYEKPSFFLNSCSRDYPDHDEKSFYSWGCWAPSNQRLFTGSSYWLCKAIADSNASHPIQGKKGTSKGPGVTSTGTVQHSRPDTSWHMLWCFKQHSRINSEPCSHSLSTAYFLGLWLKTTI